jgi:hypothetical protein
MAGYSLALPVPRRGLSDRNWGYFVPGTRSGELSKVEIISLAPPKAELIEADAALTCSAWFLPTAVAMLRLSRLPAGWDSRNALPIERTTAERALRTLAGILESQTATPGIVPTVAGGVQAEWHRGGLNVEIEFPTGQPPLIAIEDLRDGSEWAGALEMGLERFKLHLHRLRA